MPPAAAYLATAPAVVAGQMLLAAGLLERTRVFRSNRVTSPSVRVRQFLLSQRPSGPFVVDYSSCTTVHASSIHVRILSDTTTRQEAAG